MPFHSNRADAGGAANGSSSGNYSGDDRDLRSGATQYDRYESDLMDKPIYLLEHLATFTVNGESGILYPADGMRRLLQLEKSTGIWSQKMKLCLDRQWILIMDYETGVNIELYFSYLLAFTVSFALLNTNIHTVYIVKLSAVICVCLSLHLIIFFFQNIIERFPASLIKEPTAFTSNGPTELYNNILVFIVDGGTGSRSEMHIFQVCVTYDKQHFL